MSSGNVNPKVSVIIPYYNGDKFIAKTIESVLSQTYQNLEIIIIDDGSTNNISSVIGDYLPESKIKIIQHEINKGIPSARNTGIKHSTGKYITFLDQDDLWFPDKIANQISIFERAPNDLGLVFGNTNIIDSAGVVYPHLPIPNILSYINNYTSEEILKYLFLIGNFIPLITVMLRKECFTGIGLFDETIKGGSDDYDFCLRLVSKYKIEYHNVLWASRRIHMTNYSNAEMFFKDNLGITDKILAQKPFLAPLRKKKLALLYYDIGRHYQLAGNFYPARAALWKSVKYQPIASKAICALFLSFFGHWGNWLFRLYQDIYGKIYKSGIK